MPEPCGKCDLFRCDKPAPVTASDASPPSAAELVDALAHGLIDLDAHDHPDAPGLLDAAERPSLLPAAQERAERFLLPRLWEAGLETWDDQPVLVPGPNPAAGD